MAGPDLLFDGEEEKPEDEVHPVVKGLQSSTLRPNVLHDANTVVYQEDHADEGIDNMWCGATASSIKKTKKKPKKHFNDDDLM
ncbi:hypothetical protein LTS18_011994 [Coniosporium uncinatum]|uniref:Uncharacterized protein n=1 Tax=Coniosporium uncinatum TaxID=93489 RepID=A0ACC3CXW8_9PEZI|nr:hypothetical protein LTS18_011994 [Coniosporium uncinatum]